MMVKGSLICPFHNKDGDCGYSTDSDKNYLKHTKTHKPIILLPEQRLWDLRLKMAKTYRGDYGTKKTPRGYAYWAWKRKPTNMDCGTMTFMIQDQGILDEDNFQGLSTTVSEMTTT